jgi:hypothetical protein
MESSTAFHCGIFSVCVGMKFKTKEDNKTFTGLINCSEMYGEKFFKIGNKYGIIIKDEKINREICEVIINRFSDQKLTTYLVDSIYIK